MENIFCQSCGQSVLPNMRLCPQCGGRSFDKRRPPAPEETMSKPPMETPSQTSPSSGAAGFTKNTQSSNAMGFTDAIKICISKFIDFDGRASRTEYWYWTLFTTLLYCAATFIDTTVIYSDIGVTDLSVTIMAFLPSMAVSIRRLHDINKSGWWMLINLTVIGILFVMYLFCQKSSAGKNNYGELD